MTNKEHAIILVRRLYERPETIDDEGYYSFSEDIQQMEEIVEQYLNQIYYNETLGRS